MQTVLYSSGKRYDEKSFNKEKDFEKLVIDHSKTLFGKNSIIIDTKKKIESQFMGGTIPDGFLFDLSDINNPEFYIIEVELAKHSFYNHIFPQITKFFAFFKNSASQNELIEKLHSIMVADEKLLEDVKSKIGRRELFLYIKEMVENSQNILLILDEEKKELPEIINTYTDTWGKMVKVSILKQYVYNNESILSLSPSFENIEMVDITTKDTDEAESNYDEDFHLGNVLPETYERYYKLKEMLTSRIENLKFNPQRYYISLRKKKNFAFLKIRRKKIAIIAMMKEEKIRERIKNHEVISLSESVQKFYNAPCARIDVYSSNNLEEIVELLEEIQK
jgi:predicted transport protein